MDRAWLRQDREQVNVVLRMIYVLTYSVPSFSFSSSRSSKSVERLGCLRGWIVFREKHVD